MLDWRITWPELEPPPTLAILPLGSVEQHGPWLPIGSDWMLAVHLGEAVARALHAWLLPAQPYSCAQEHQDFPGTITLRPATLAALITDIAASVARARVPNLLVLNMHGGNWALKSIVRDLNRQQQDITAFTLNPWEGLPGLALADDLHAGDFETSLWLHLDPAQVRPGVEDCTPGVTPERLDQVGVRAFSPRGHWGPASRATADAGATRFAWMVDSVVRRMHDALQTLEAVKPASHDRKECP